MSIRRALISVWDKTGVVEFARALTEFGVELLSTGGTARQLREAGLPVRDVSEVTGFPEMLDGRVKTLHPRIHAALLYLRGHPEHEATVRRHEISPIDLVCINLYPFEATVARPGVTLEEAIENIDIGGPAMIRSAAKNMRSVTVVVDPADYGRVVECMRANGGDTTEALRWELGRKAFARTAAYDAAIASWLASREPRDDSLLVRVWTDGTPLRYGENPHQGAVFYREAAAPEACAAWCEVLHGKEMSYNNYLDADAAVEAVREHVGAPAAVVIKHTNPCGCATAPTLAEALAAAWEGDPVSAFGSIIAVTVPVDLAAAEVLKGRFVEALVAPDYTPEALEFLKAKSRDIRLLKLHRPLTPPSRRLELRSIHGGVLVQDSDAELLGHWVVPTETPFPDELRPLAEFGIKVCKHIKSNAICIVHEYRPGYFTLLGMGAGQPNRVDAIRRLAAVRVLENISRLYDSSGGYGKTPAEFQQVILQRSVLVSDAFFPFADNIRHAAELGIRYIVQPGGSRRDEEVIAECDRYGIAMAFTGLRHFRH